MIEFVSLLYITERVLVSIIINKDSKVYAKNVVEYGEKDILYFWICAWLLFFSVYNIKVIYSSFFFYLCRRISQMWQRSCLRRSLRRAATIFLTPKAEKTTVVSSLKRAGEEGGCEEVLQPAYSRFITDSSTLQPLSHSLTVYGPHT